MSKKLKFKVKDFVTNHKTELHSIKNAVIDWLVDNIKKIPKYQHLKGSSQLIIDLCNNLENAVKNNCQVLDKKQLICEAIKQAYPLSSPEEIEKLSDDIQTYFDNGLIKREVKTTVQKVSNFFFTKKDV